MLAFFWPAGNVPARPIHKNGNQSEISLIKYDCDRKTWLYKGYAYVNCRPVRNWTSSLARIAAVSDGGKKMDESARKNVIKWQKVHWKWMNPKRRMPTKWAPGRPRSWWKRTPTLHHHWVNYRILSRSWHHTNSAQESPLPTNHGYISLQHLNFCCCCCLGQICMYICMYVGHSHKNKTYSYKLRLYVCAEFEAW